MKIRNISTRISALRAEIQTEGLHRITAAPTRSVDMKRKSKRSKQTLKELQKVSKDTGVKRGERKKPKGRK
jgi:hypothetical protein